MGYKGGNRLDGTGRSSEECLGPPGGFGKAGSAILLECRWRRVYHLGDAMKRKSPYETDERTSRRMSAVRPKNTTPEKTVRSVLTELGCRYRLHRLDLPGRPDVVFPGAS